MRGAIALLALLQPQSGPPPQAPPPLKNWSIQRKEVNLRTGREEVTTLLRGEEAIPIDLQKKIFEIRTVEATYFTEAKPGAESEKILIRAGRGRYDDPAKHLDLSDGVRLEREEDGSVLRAPSASVSFGTRRLIVEQGFEFHGPAGKLTGEKVTSDLDKALREITVERQGFLEMTGRARNLVRPAAGSARPPKLVVNQVYSRGPLVVKDPRDRNEPVVVIASEGVRLDRQDPAGNVTLHARSVEITAFRRLDPVTGRTALQAERLTATGPLGFAGTTFADGWELEGSADALAWEQKDYADWVEDVLELSGSPVRFRNGPYRIESRRARIERLEGRALFQEEVAAQLASGRTPESRPMNLRCATLQARTAPGERALREIEAAGRVFLEGLGEKGGNAQADRFVWDLAEERGLLEGRPFVRVFQETSTILAPRIVLESPSIIVLKGSKLIKLVQTGEDGKAAEYRVTAEGDLVFDSSGERAFIRMRDRCSIRTEEFHILAERVNVKMGADGKGVESLRASGGVRARQLKEGSLILGERLDYEPRTQELRLEGRPDAVVEARGSSVVQERLLVVWETDPLTGRKVRYTHMLGGRQPVRLLVDDRQR
jgi:hypothetical protein